MEPNISGSSVMEPVSYHPSGDWKLLKRLPDIWKVCAPLNYSIFEGIFQRLWSLVKALRYNPESRGFPMLSLEFLHWHNPSGRTVALGLTQPLTEMSTRHISWGGIKAGRCVGLTLPPSYAECLEIWEPQPPGTLRACPGL